ncbi:IS30 family transposase [Microlunatus soli]|nr:IS30 family transposase [Microlunatus soli]
MAARFMPTEEFWAALRSGASILVASRAVGVSPVCGYRWLADAGGWAGLGLPAPGHGRLEASVSARLRPLFWAELRKGAGVRAAAAAAGVSDVTGYRWFQQAGGVRPPTVNPEVEAQITPGHGMVTFTERCRVEDLLNLHYKPSRIADLLGRPRSTITREIARGTDQVDGSYRARIGQSKVEQRRHRAGARPRLVPGTRLFDEVVERLVAKHSPEQISQRLRLDFPADPEMRVSHETIYQALYVRPKGELAREVEQRLGEAKALRTGRVQRRHQGRQLRPKLKDMSSIHDRPAEADDRLMPGHWEGDLIIGAHGKSAIGTLVERTTRFVLLLHLPDDHTAQTVAKAMTAKITELPEQLKRSLTWDQGSEMALHTKITAETGIPVYFCDPHSPWQRGTNENTNGLLRQYFPKGADLSFYGPGLLDQVAAELNTRPRKTLEWATPAEALQRLLSNDDDQSVASTA